jgi:single-strand DNA-binding protein
MATDNTVTLVGNLVDDPELRYTPQGQAVARMRVAVNRRFRNNQTGEWEEKLDGYFTVNVWRDHAENVADSLRRGNRVLVVGRLESKSYEDKDGQTRWITEVTADEVCPSLRWARANISKVSRAEATTGGGSGGGGAGGNGSWGGPPPTSSSPPDADDVPF